MFPKPPSWVVRSNEWASLGQWGYLLVTFSLGSAATLWFGPNHEVGWGAVVWGGAFFAIVVALAAALSAHAYATFRGRSGVAQAAEPGRQAGDLDRPAPGLVAAGAQAAREREAGLSQEASANPEKPEALTAKRELSMFLTSYLLPACSSIRKLHFAIMQQICGENKLLLDLADQGFEQHRDFGKFHGTLGKLGI